MGCGRKPKTNIKDNDHSHFTKEFMDERIKSTPVYDSQEFIPPETLSSKELEIWNWLVKVFKDTINCAVSDADIHLMELYCRAKASYDDAVEQLKKDPRPFISYEDKLKANPYIKIRDDSSKLCLKFFDQLGLSPVARARIGISRAKATMSERFISDIMNRSDDD